MTFMANRRSRSSSCPGTSSGSRVVTTRRELDLVRRLWTRFDHCRAGRGLLGQFSAPENIVKLSGIAVHPRPPLILSAAGMASIRYMAACPRLPPAPRRNRDLTYIGVSGDGDTLSIGLGQFLPCDSPQSDMVYVIENNGVYGLTKGQFSASADIGSTAKKGESTINRRSIRCSSRSPLASPSSRAVSPVTRRSWYRCCRRRCIIRASR